MQEGESIQRFLRALQEVQASYRELPAHLQIVDAYEATDLVARVALGMSVRALRGVAQAKRVVDDARSSKEQRPGGEAPPSSR